MINAMVVLALASVLGVPLEANAIEIKDITIAQEEWIDKLRYCESGGNNMAINWKDTDGTPSWYAFQFKFGTFKSLSTKYGLLPRVFTDNEFRLMIPNYGLQREIVRRMLVDEEINMSRQFPACTRRIGLPPKI